MADKSVKKPIAKSNTDSFIAEFPLRTTPSDERAMDIRLRACNAIYNAALGEGLRRLDLMRQSKKWQTARKTKNKDDFRAVQKQFKFSWVELIRFTQECRNECWIKDHLGSQEAQATTKLAFRAIEKYLYEKRSKLKKPKPPVNGMPSVGRPRFRRPDDYGSVENQTNASGLRFKDNQIVWFDLRIQIIFDHRDKEGYQAEVLKHRVKYVRIVRRPVRGRLRWYAQLICEGKPPQRRVTGEDHVGLDLGPSMIAMVSDNNAALEKFCPTIDHHWREERIIQRGMDRSRRAMNPEAFDEKGRFKKGHRLKKSNRYRKLALKRRERERRLASERKRSHNELANRILGQGKIVHTEKLSYRAFQKRYGKSVKIRAPGMFITTLKRKINAISGKIVEINPYKTALSQFDHTTGEFVKKPLSQRVHNFGDGKTEPVHRDLYSAFLARHCEPEILNVRQVIDAWAGAEPLLRVDSHMRRTALSNNNIRVGGFGLPHMLERVREYRPSKASHPLGEGPDVVPQGRAGKSQEINEAKIPYVEERVIKS